MPTTDAASAAPSSDPLSQPEPGAGRASIEAPERWIESRRRARHRRMADARERRRRRLGRRGTGSLIAAMTVAVGAAGAHEVRVAKRASAPKASAAVLATGSRGDAVAALQRMLGIAADGVYGPRTAAAVRRAQRARGLLVDGVAGPQTLSALDLPPAAGGTVSAGRTSAGTSTAVLERIAQCESGGDPRAVGAGGRYRGKYQFTLETWRAVGGKGDPVDAPETEQDRRAALLLAREGTGPWPVCARAA